MGRPDGIANRPTTFRNDLAVIEFGYRCRKDVRACSPAQTTEDGECHADGTDGSGLRFSALAAGCVARQQGNAASVPTDHRQDTAKAAPEAQPLVACSALPVPPRLHHRPGSLWRAGVRDPVRHDRPPRRGADQRRRRRRVRRSGAQRCRLLPDAAGDPVGSRHRGAYPGAPLRPQEQGPVCGRHRRASLRPRIRRPFLAHRVADRLDS